MSSNITKWVLILALIAFVGWDIFLAFDGIPGNTISEVTLRYTGNIVIPVILLVGFVMGHLFWPQHITRPKGENVMWNWLKGKKSNIIAVAIAGVTVAGAAGYIDDETRNILLGLLGGGGLAALRAGVEASGPKVAKKK
jgi:hypothetical protein